MLRCAVTAALWFAATWGVGSYAQLFLDFPRAVVLVPSVAIAALVWLALARHERYLHGRSAAPVGVGSRVVAGQLLEA
jgi:hypothetical protein